MIGVPALPEVESGKIKFPRAEAIVVAREMCVALDPYCERLIVAGSLRRRKKEVGDVEILFVPRINEEADGLFDTMEIDLANRAINYLLSIGSIEKRRNVNGSETWGEKNKLARHASGIPVDFFATREANWFNYLVVRTGPAASNVRIASAAQAKGWKWNAYGSGFINEHGIAVQVTSEREAFELVGLRYLKPWER